MSNDDNLTTDPKTRMIELLDDLDNIQDDIALKKAEGKVAQRRYDRLARQYPEIAAELAAARGEGEDEEGDDAPKRGRPKKS